ncbi:MAG TPA: cupin domain-containing protein [Solirubrobacteraceae bacterium]|jgi:mannose-6-phosphate isomerase-like protein (cupin superfamily)
MLVRSLDEVRVSATACLIEGETLAEFLLPVSCFVTSYGRDAGPGPHVHPYPELFIVQDGRATFSVGGTDREVAAGHFVVVPAETVHSFRNPADAVLRVVSVQPSPRVEQRFVDDD